MSGGKYILIVDDDPAVGEVIEKALEIDGYANRRVTDGDEALEAIRDKTPDLIILDRVLPGASGDDIVRDLKRDPETARIPVIMLSGKAEESDELVGLALGADDYVTKPFSPKLLLARVDALLRRSAAAVHESNADAVSVEPVTIEDSEHRVRIGPNMYKLTNTEYKLLTALIAARGFVLDETSLINAVLGKESQAHKEDIKPMVDALCEKLGPAAEFIQQVEGVGYAFCAPPGSTLRLPR